MEDYVLADRIRELYVLAAAATDESERRALLQELNIALEEQLERLRKMAKKLADDNHRSTG